MRPKLLIVLIVYTFLMLHGCTYEMEHSWEGEPLEVDVHVDLEGNVLVDANIVQELTIDHAGVIGLDVTGSAIGVAVEMK